MRAVLLTLTLTLALSACGSETGLVSPPDAAGVMNPRPLPPTRRQDRILQVTQPEVDVLWVVDDSCSMGDEQDAVAENFPRFFEFFEGSGLDWHIGVVSTDMDNSSKRGRLITRSGHRYLDPETPQAASVFADMTRLGTSGSGIEKGSDATYTALEVERDGYNLGFLREQSGVHVVLLSDEEDSSVLITADELAAYLSGLRQDPDDVTFSSIALPNSRYAKITNLVGGIFWPIAQPEWTVVLEQLGLQAAGLKREYFLSELPVPGTLSVTVVDGGVTYAFTEGEDWAYNAVRNSIAFHDYVPRPMAEVVVEYQLLSAHHGD